MYRKYTNMWAQKGGGVTVGDQGKTLVTNNNHMLTDMFFDSNFYYLKNRFKAHRQDFKIIKCKPSLSDHCHQCH